MHGDESRGLDAWDHETFDSDYCRSCANSYLEEAILHRYGAIDRES